MRNPSQIKPNPTEVKPDPAEVKPDPSEIKPKSIRNPTKILINASLTPNLAEILSQRQPRPRMKPNPTEILRKSKAKAKASQSQPKPSQPHGEPWTSASERSDLGALVPVSGRCPVVGEGPVGPRGKECHKTMTSQQKS